VANNDGGGGGNTARDHLVCMLSPRGFAFPVTQSLSVDEEYHDGELLMLMKHFTDQRPNSSLYHEQRLKH
jgi:hypothetical protein